MLVAQNLFKKYPGLIVVNDVSLKINRGEVVSIIGPSGAGKSTLLHLLGVLDKPDSGTVTIDNTNVFQLPSKKQAAFRNKHLGFVFQFHYLLNEFSVLKNVMLPALKLNHLTEKEITDKAMKWLTLLTIDTLASKKPNLLSGGEKQRMRLGLIFGDSFSLVGGKQ